MANRILVSETRSMNYGAINIDPETMSGTPVFTDSRVPIQSLFDYLEGGETLQEFLENFPSVKKEYALQVLQMAKTKHHPIADFTRQSKRYF